MSDKIKIDRAVLQQTVEWIKANAEHDQYCDLLDIYEDGMHKPCSCGLNAIITTLHEALAKQASQPLTGEQRFAAFAQAEKQMMVRGSPYSCSTRWTNQR